MLGGDEMRAAIMAIEADASLTEAEKARRRQDLFAGKWAPAPAAGGARLRGPAPERAAALPLLRGGVSFPLDIIGQAYPPSTGGPAPCGRAGALCAARARLPRRGASG